MKELLRCISEEVGPIGLMMVIFCTLIGVGGLVEGEDTALCLLVLLPNLLVVMALIKGVLKWRKERKQTFQTQ